MMGGEPIKKIGLRPQVWRQPDFFMCRYVAAVRKNLLVDELLAVADLQALSRLVDALSGEVVNVVVGAAFSGIGLELLDSVSHCDVTLENDDGQFRSIALASEVERSGTTGGSGGQSFALNADIFLTCAIAALVHGVFSIDASDPVGNVVGGIVLAPSASNQGKLV